LSIPIFRFFYFIFDGLKIHLFPSFLTLLAVCAIL
jgi:hypothetical protein